MLKQNKDSILYLHNRSKQPLSSPLWTICLKRKEKPPGSKCALQSVVKFQGVGSFPQPTNEPKDCNGFELSAWGYKA